MKRLTLTLDSMKFKMIMWAIIAMSLLIGCSMRVANSRSESVSNEDVSKTTVSKSVKIGKFSKIEASQGIKVIFTQGNFTGEARVKTTPSAEKYLKIESGRGVLELSYKSHSGNIEGPTIVYVQAPDLNEINLTSAASVEVTGDLKLQKSLAIDLTSAAYVMMNNVTGVDLEIELTSASSVSMGDLNLNKFEIEVSSAASAKFGLITANVISIEGSSASKCEISGFNGTRVDAEVSSGANVKISHITAVTVSAEASSGGAIDLNGECGTLNAESSSGGTIRSGSLKTGQNRNKKQSNQTKTKEAEMVMPRQP